MNEIVKEEIKIYTMMKEYKKLDRATAKEVVKMKWEQEKKLNKYIHDAKAYLSDSYKKIDNNKKMTDAEKGLLKVLLKYSI